MRPKTKYLIGTPLFIGFAALLIWSMFAARDWPEGTTGIIGRVWTNATVTTASASLPACIYYVTEQDRAFRESIGTGSRRGSITYRTVHYNQYRLQSRRLPDGELLTEVITNIRDNNETKAEGPQIMGPVPEGLWVFQDGPVLCNFSTLAPMLNLDTLRQKNPEVADKLPSGIEGYKVAGAFKALVVKTKDLQFYVVDAATGIMSPADRATMEADTGQKNQSQAFNYLSAYGCSRGSTSVNDFRISSFLTSTSQWYGLLSEDKLAQLSKWPTRNDRPYAEEWRQLCNVPYILDDRNEPEIDPSAVKPVGNARFLNGGFLMRTDRKVWDVPDPSSSLVLHKKDLEKTTPWSLARLARDGQVIYDASTGLADLHTITDAGNTLVLYGFKDFTEPTNTRPHLLGFVDTTTGKAIVHDVSVVRGDRK